MTPSVTVSEFAGTASFAAARSTSMPRTSAQARRSAVPLFSIDWLPAVCPSSGDSAVSAEKICTRDSAQVELLGGDLPERGQDALPELDLAGVDGGVAVAADPHPGLQRTVVVEAARQPRRRCALGQQFGRIEREGEHEAAHAPW